MFPRLILQFRFTAPLKAGFYYLLLFLFHNYFVLCVSLQNAFFYIF